MYRGYGPYMNYGINTSRFNFTNILNTTQKTLNIINQALPVVKEVRPIIRNAKTLFKVAKGFNNINNEIPKQSIKEEKTQNEGLNFFI